MVKLPAHIEEAIHTAVTEIGWCYEVDDIADCVYGIINSPSEFDAHDVEIIDRIKELL